MYYIADFPTLFPSMLFKRNRANNFPFPLNVKSTVYYYYARNTIWHLMQNLDLHAEQSVLMPSYHNGVEVAPILELGIKIKYYRIDKGMNIDFDHLEGLINDTTKVLYVIHYLGFPQDLQKISHLKKAYNLYVVEDCALSFLSKVDDRYLGSFGDVAIYCFYKTVPVPNGGAVVFNNTDLEGKWPKVSPDSYSIQNTICKKILQNFELRSRRVGRLFSQCVRALASSAIKMTSLKPTLAGTMEFDRNKVDWGMSPICWKILENIDYEQVVKRRRANFKLLTERLSGFDRLRLVFDNLPQGICPLFYPVIYEGNKRELVQKLRHYGIGAIDFWSWRHPAVNTGLFPEAEYLRDHVIELPIYQDLNEYHIEYIYDVLQRCLN